MPERPFVTPSQGAYLLLCRFEKSTPTTDDPTKLFYNLERRGNWPEFLQDSRKSRLIAERVLQGIQVAHDSGFLSNREKLVMVQHYALEGGQIPTLEEIGKEFGVAPSRITSIEKEAIKRLKGFRNSFKG